MELSAPKVVGTEVAEYRATPHPKPFFKTVLDSKRIFEGGKTTVTTRVDAGTLNAAMATTLMGQTLWPRAPASDSTPQSTSIRWAFTRSLE